MTPPAPRRTLWRRAGSDHADPPGHHEPRIAHCGQTALRAAGQRPARQAVGRVRAADRGDQRGHAVVGLRVVGRVARRAGAARAGGRDHALLESRCAHARRRVARHLQHARLPQGARWHGRGPGATGRPRAGLPRDRDRRQHRPGLRVRRQRRAPVPGVQAGTGRQARAVVRLRAAHGGAGRDLHRHLAHLPDLATRDLAGDLAGQPGAQLRSPAAGPRCAGAGQAAARRRWRRQGAGDLDPRLRQPAGGLRRPRAQFHPRRQPRTAHAADRGQGRGRRDGRGGGAVAVRDPRGGARAARRARHGGADRVLPDPGARDRRRPARRGLRGQCAGRGGTREGAGAGRRQAGGVAPGRGRPVRLARADAGAVGDALEPPAQRLPLHRPRHGGGHRGCGLRARERHRSGHVGRGTGARVTNPSIAAAAAARAGTASA